MSLASNILVFFTEAAGAKTSQSTPVEVVFQRAVGESASRTPHGEGTRAAGNEVVHQEKQGRYCFNWVTFSIYNYTYTYDQQL